MIAAIVLLALLIIASAFLSTRIAYAEPVTVMQTTLTPDSLTLRDGLGGTWGVSHLSLLGEEDNPRRANDKLPSWHADPWNKFTQIETSILHDGSDFYFGIGDVPEGPVDCASTRPHAAFCRQDGVTYISVGDGLVNERTIIAAPLDGRTILQVLNMPSSTQFYINGSPTGMISTTRPTGEGWTQLSIASEGTTYLERTVEYRYTE